ncbi:MAG: ATP-binding cassette domain-containing protein [Ignavibacteriaceae bacterium]
MNIVELKNIYLTLQHREILKNISLGIPKGKVSVILGPSGAGKSSILKIILGLWKPEKGSVKIGDIDISPLSELEMLPVRKNMGIVFQGNALFDSLTVEENVGYFLYEQNKISHKEIKERIETALSFVNLSGTNDLSPDQLSGGMKKRVAIARAMVFNPEIILFDEPTTGLDPINSKHILDLIARLREQGTTAVVVTHILNDAVSIGDKLTLINGGTLIESGTVSEMLNSNKEFVKAFFYEVYQDAELLKNC